MFRRIELINEHPLVDLPGHVEGFSAFKNGLMGMSAEAVVDAWIAKLNSPRRQINKNCRFYFTEKGWREIGKDVVAACIKSKQKYRVLSTEEHDVDVVYRDDLQVAVRPKRKYHGSRD